ncbi:MAG TPA: carbohydrate ABC transporter permease, partial [Tepidisphaeraceae bacterium]|nr:carbohydrate ABC transporter permease [Tepidisphaeraceae bacterium]
MTTMQPESRLSNSSVGDAAAMTALGRKVRGRPQPGRWVAFVALCLISISFLFPLIWMLSTSLKPLDQVMAYPPKWIPNQIELHKTESGSTTPIPENYWRVVTHEKMDFPLYTRNTLTIAVLSIIGTVLSSSLVAYGFAKIRFKGRGILFAIMLSTMMIPFPVLMISLFSIFRWIGDHTPFQMLGTLRPLWLPAFFGNAFNIFLLRQFFVTIPDELSEAARIDGCSEFGIWWRIIMPLSKPALSVVALFTFMASWKDFLGPLIYLQHPDQYTLALGLQVFQSSQGGTEWNILMGASLLILTPV